MSVDLGTSMSVDFDDRAREIQNPSTSFVDEVGAYSFRNPSQILKCFNSRDEELLKKAFCTYVRPLLEYCT